jgi:hypothetical protein
VLFSDAGITAYLPVGSILFFYFIDYAVFILITFCVVRPEVVAEDKLIAAKSGYLNFPFGSLELLYSWWVGTTTVLNQFKMTWRKMSLMIVK